MKSIAFLALAVAGICWGLGFPTGKLILTETDAAHMVLLRFVVAALAARFGERTRVGDPHAEGATMGPLASLDQLADVRSAVGRLIDAGGTVAYGDPTDQADAVTLAGRAPGDGAFMSPVVLTWDDPETPAVHTIEAFGPVTSVLEYTDVEAAVHLAALGGGSLVATVCSHDPQVVTAVTRGIAAHHGRVHVLDRSAPLLLEADGQRVAELNAGDCIEFGLAERPAQILRLHSQGFYERARRKLQITDSSELAPR